MKTVYHPTLPTSREVPESQAQEWKEQGWRFTPPTTLVAEKGPEVFAPKKPGRVLDK